MMSSTTRSICLVGEAPQRLLAVARLDDAIAVALEREREELLDRVLVVDEQNGGGGIGHGLDGHALIVSCLADARSSFNALVRRVPADNRPATAPLPTIARPWQLTRSRRRRRRRRGSLERPLNGRLYRSAFLVLSLPLLIAAFSVVRPAPLPAPQLPPTFDGAATKELAADLAQNYPTASRGRRTR